MSIDPGRPPRHALGVDFGTSNTVAVARWPDGRARPILIDGSPLLPSAVYAEPDGQLIVGRDAVHSARLDPARFEPNPKRRIDEGRVLLGEHEVPVVDLIAAVLARLAEEWHRAVGPVRPDVTLTCPATWGATRRTLLAEAAARAGLTGARLVAEPVAAATYFADVLGRDVPIGSIVVVHDFGAGTFDASVVARTAEGFEVLAVDGRDDLGGLDVDAAIVEHLGTLFGAEPDWERLSSPTTVEERRAQRQLWDDVRVAKERLSRTQSADLVVPLLNREAHLTRDELETLARPVLDQTVQVTRSLLRWAELPEGRLAGVFLVGGASRIPLVATLLHRALGEPPVVIEQPELVVAEGSILADAALLATGPAAPGPTAEFRLVASRRAEFETVRVSAASLGGVGSPRDSGASGDLRFSGSSGAVVDDQETVRSGLDGTRLPPPAVDPWPNAAPDPWVPDPEQTVATEAPWRQEPSTRPVSPARPEAPRPRGTARPAPPASAAPASAGAQLVRPQSAPPQSSGSGSAQSSGSGSAQSSRSAQSSGSGSAQSESEPPRSAQVGPGQSGSARSRSARKSGSGPSGSAQTRSDPKSGSGPSESVQSGSGPSGSVRSRSVQSGSGPSASVRSGSGPKPGAVQKSGRREPASTSRWAVPSPAGRSVGRRRRGGFVRLIQVLLSILILIAVPLAAMVVAYSYNTGESLQDAATNVAGDIRRLLRSRIS